MLGQYDTIAVDLANTLKEKRGFSFAPQSQLPPVGYLVSIPMYERKFYGDIDVRVLAFHIQTLITIALSAYRGEVVMGGWCDHDSMIYLDLNTWVSNIEDAERLAIERKQLAYYEISTGRVIRTNTLEDYTQA